MMKMNDEIREIYDDAPRHSQLGFRFFGFLGDVSLILAIIFGMVLAADSVLNIGLSINWVGLYAGIAITFVMCVAFQFGIIKSALEDRR